MAIAECYLAAGYNRPGFDIINRFNVWDTVPPIDFPNNRPAQGDQRPQPLWSFPMAAPG